MSAPEQVKAPAATTEEAQQSALELAIGATKQTERSRAEELIVLLWTRP
jgi:hypothetical protein